MIIKLTHYQTNKQALGIDLFVFYHRVDFYYIILKHYNNAMDLV